MDWWELRWELRHKMLRIPGVLFQPFVKRPQASPQLYLCSYPVLQPYQRILGFWARLACLCICTMLGSNASLLFLVYPWLWTSSLEGHFRPLFTSLQGRQVWLIQLEGFAREAECVRASPFSLLSFGSQLGLLCSPYSPGPTLPVTEGVSLANLVPLAHRYNLHPPP